MLLTVIVFVTVRVARTVHGWVLRHHHVTTLTHVEAGTVIMTKDEL